MRYPLRRTAAVVACWGAGRLLVAGVVGILDGQRLGWYRGGRERIAGHQVLHPAESADEDPGLLAGAQAAEAAGGQRRHPRVEPVRAGVYAGLGKLPLGPLGQTLVMAAV